jgi:hypothetical protein
VRLIDTKEKKGQKGFKQKEVVNEDFPRNKEANKYSGFIHRKMAEIYAAKAEKCPTAIRSVRELSANNKENVLTIGRGAV